MKQARGADEIDAWLARYDEDKDGRLYADEIEDLLLEQLGIKASQNELAELIAEIDAGGDGRVDGHALRRLVYVLDNMQGRHSVEVTVFLLLDTDMRGYLDASQVERFLRDVSPSFDQGLFEEGMAKANLSNRERICCDDFQRLFAIFRK